MSTRLPQDILHRLWVFRDYRQQHARGCVRARPTLLPISQSGGGGAELGRALRLAEPHLRSDPTVGCFLATRSTVFTARLVFAVVFTLSSYRSAGYPATRIGTNRFIALRSALLRLAFSFFP